MARLLDSVPPEVKMMSAGSAATWAATLGASEIDGGGRPPAAGRVVAGGVAVLVAQVGQHRVEHFGATGVLALWSR